MAFENLVGNEEVKKLLVSMVEQRKITHGYLFVGPSGIGKTLFAKARTKGLSPSLLAEGFLVINPKRQLCRAPCLMAQGIARGFMIRASVDVHGQTCHSISYMTMASSAYQQICQAKLRICRLTHD